MSDAVEPRKRLFVSYKSDVAAKIAQVCHCLERQASVDVFYFDERVRTGDFTEEIEEQIRSHEYFLLFISEHTKESDWQGREVAAWLKAHEKTRADLKRFAVVELDGATELPPGTAIVLKNPQDVQRQTPKHPQTSSSDDWGPSVAMNVLRGFDFQLAPFDDLPLELHASYEKEIIQQYVSHGGSASVELVRKGYPASWPAVSRHADPLPAPWSWTDNKLSEDECGSFRSDSAAVLVDARVDPKTTDRNEFARNLIFPEAGPRPSVIAGDLQVRVLVSGGIAPGINAVISGIAERHERYSRALEHDHDFRGYREGLRPLCCEDVGRRELKLTSQLVRPFVNHGGSLLPTSRVDALLTKDASERKRLLETMADRIHTDGVDILYVIGGEGSMRAAHALHSVHRARYPNRAFSVIGVPKTMDNDILWVWQSFGFLSAVENAREHILQLLTEATSNPRLAVVQLFGSASGFVATHAAFGSNACDIALIPEVEFSMEDICKNVHTMLTKRLRNGIPAGVIVMAETAVPSDFERYMSEPYLELTKDEKKALVQFKRSGNRVVGQTPDELRKAALKIVQGVLQQYIRVVMGEGRQLLVDGEAVGRAESLSATPYWCSYRVFASEPRHLIRSVKPTVTDVALGTRLGTMAVDMAMAGYNDCMISQWLTEYVAVPLKLVVLGRKQVPPEGIFWRSVVSATSRRAMETLALLPQT